ncbi:MAG: serine--tRNA ligase [Nanoarchaeota archaeon]
MIDVNLIREKPNLIKENIKKKFQQDKLHLVDKFITLDEEWRKLKSKLDELRHERNLISEKINLAKKEKSQDDFKKLIKKAQDFPKEIQTYESRLEKLEQETKQILLQIPNIMSKHVPIGKDASQNKEIKKSGKIPKFNFEVKNHVELLENLGLADFEKSAKTSGSGFYYLKNELGYLNQALIRFTIDFLKKKNYTYVETPLMLRSNIAFAAFDKKAIEESVYKIENEDLSLIGTSEQSLLGMHNDEIIQEDKLPLKYFSYSMCFRKEVGAHGINEKGLWRTHQFNKVEQVIFSKPEDSEKYFNELLKNSEDILKALELPYRIVDICSGDLSDWKNYQKDIEVYRPTTKDYGEVVSLSNCTDYQARKLNIRCESKDGEKRVLHTLNDTAIATSRILVAIIENFQQKDGSIKIPIALHKYTRFKVIKNVKR